MEYKQLCDGLRSMLPEKVDYAELINSPIQSAYGICFVYEDMESYIIEEAANAIEKLQSDNARLQIQLTQREHDK